MLAVPLLLAATWVQAGVGIGTQPNYPTPVVVGDTGLPVTVTFANTSDGDQAVGVVTVFPGDIKHTPSCGSFTFPCSAPDLGVFALSATGTGIDGPGPNGPAPIPDDSVCAGISFDISAPDGLTGEVTLTPNPAVNIEMFRFDECIIEFTADVTALPTIDSNLVQNGTQTLQTSQVAATHLPTQVSSGGTGSDETTVTDCNISITKCVVVDTDNDGSLEDETCVAEATGIVGALAEWRIDVSNDGPGLAGSCTLTDPTLGIDQVVDFSSGPVPTITDPGECVDPRTDNTATLTCNTCDGVAQVNQEQASATLICEECDVQVDKQISCDGGTTWYDQGLVEDAAGDGDDPCAGLGTDPIMVRYQVANPNANCDLSNCSLVETNTTFGNEPSVPDLASGQQTNVETDLPGELTPACDTAFGDPGDPNEPNLVTVTCDTEYGTTATANDDGNFSCLEVALLVDRNVDCGGGAADMTLVDSNEDGTNGCSTLDGNDVNWGYQAQNTGDATLYACVLTDSNTTVSSQVTVGTLAPNGAVPFDATNNPIPCSPELEASETPYGEVTLECCVRDVATLAECNAGDRVSVYDRSTVSCETPGLDIVKRCIDGDGDGADESVEVEVTSNASTNEPFYTDCDVTDTFHIDIPCAELDSLPGTDVPVTPDNYALGSDDSQVSTGDLPAFTAPSCNTASVSCLDPAGAPVVREAVPVECTPPTLGCLTRTPGFWGNRPDITARFVLPGEGGPLEVCGLELDNVGFDNNKGDPVDPVPASIDPTLSAVEAICSVGKDHKIMGEQETQLVRQCTAAALNFAVSEQEGGDCSSTENPYGVAISDAMDACCDASSACTGAPTTYTINECIGIIDWFNNSTDTLATDIFSGLGAADSYNCVRSRNNKTVVNPYP
jgi:hypothetical protein